jgi:hypothetical protein
MHRHHNPVNAPDITPDNDGCYDCHPGMDTQCLRCVMSQRYGIGCVDRHGSIVQVAKNPTPWVSEPKCSNPACHGAAYATDQPLCRNSKGHGGLYCAACHDSPHAIAVSREASDAIKFLELQGSAGTLRVCTTCHAAVPMGAFRHAAAASVVVVKTHTRLTIATLHSSYSRWTRFRVSGTVLPKHTARSAQVVYIKLYRRLSGHWVLHKTVAATLGSSGSYYAATVQLQHRGQWRTRPYTPADSRHLATYGPSEYVFAR